MDQEVVIRTYHPNDKQAIITLLRLNTPAYFSPEEENDLVYYLDNEIDEYYVLEMNNIIIGCGGINYDEDGTTGKISWDILHPDYQGKGFGSLLLSFRIEKLKELKHITTISVRTSQLVYRFYEKYGFKLVETIKDYWAPGIDMYRMIYV